METWIDLIWVFEELILPIDPPQSLMKYVLKCVEKYLKYCFSAHF